MTSGAPDAASASGAEAAGVSRSDLSKLARGGLISLAGIVGNGGFQLLLTLVVTRGLAAQGSGVFFQGVALFMILSRISQFGADTGLIRMIPRYRALERTQDIRSMLWVALLPVATSATLLGMLLFAFSPQLGGLLARGVQDARTLDYLRWLAPVLPLAALGTVIVQGTRGFGTTVPYVLVENLGKPAVRVVLVWAAVVGGLGIGGALMGWALPAALGFGAALLILHRLLRRAEGHDRGATRQPRAWRRLAREFWRFSAPRGLAGIFQVAILWLDVLLVGALRTAEEAGIYAAASRYVVAGAFALQAVRFAIAPQISDLLARRSRERMERVYRVGTWWAIALSWPGYISLAVFAPFFLGLFGDEFRAAETALVILSGAMLLNIGVGNASVLLLMSGKSFWNLLNTIASLTLYVVLDLILIPRYGINGAAVGWAISIAVNQLATLLEVRVWLKVHPFGREYVLLSLWALVCYGLLGLIVRVLFGSSPTVVAAFGLGATALYLALLWRHREMLQLPVLREGLRSGRRRPAPEEQADPKG